MRDVKRFPTTRELEIQTLEPIHLSHTPTQLSHLNTNFSQINLIPTQHPRYHHEDFYHSLSPRSPSSYSCTAPMPVAAPVIIRLLASRNGISFIDYSESHYRYTALPNGIYTFKVNLQVYYNP